MSGNGRLKLVLSSTAYISANGGGMTGKYPADLAEVASPSLAGGWSKEAVIGAAALVIMILLPCLGVLWKNIKVRAFCRRWWNRVYGRASRKY